MKYQNSIINLNLVSAFNFSMEKTLMGNSDSEDRATTVLTKTNHQN